MKKKYPYSVRRYCRTMWLVILPLVLISEIICEISYSKPVLNHESTGLEVRRYQPNNDMNQESTSNQMFVSSSRTSSSEDQNKVSSNDYEKDSLKQKSGNNKAYDITESLLIHKILAQLNLQNLAKHLGIRRISAAELKAFKESRADRYLASSDSRIQRANIRTSGHNNIANSANSTMTSSNKSENKQQYDLSVKAALKKFPSVVTGFKGSSELPRTDCRQAAYSFKARKRDKFGNECKGTVVASICFGGCETAEFYAAWMQPSKKTVHKVCIHKERVRRVARLRNCRFANGTRVTLYTKQTKSGASFHDEGIDSGSSSGSGSFDEQKNFIDKSLFEELSRYYYTDAKSCWCSTCSSSDTSCIGGQTEPTLPILTSLYFDDSLQQRQNGKYDSS